MCAGKCCRRCFAPWWVFSASWTTKAFVADPVATNDIYELRGIDREAGCMVLVRPDRHVA